MTSATATPLRDATTRDPQPDVLHRKGGAPPAPRQLDPERLGDHLDRLYRAAWALTGSHASAEDLVQDTYARVLARPRFLRHNDDLGYLLRALRNTFYSTARTARHPAL